MAYGNRQPPVVGIFIPHSPLGVVVGGGGGAVVVRATVVVVVAVDKREAGGV